MAYCLGQLGDVRALATLTHVLRDEHEHVMVRHEAAEAMGAIGHPDALDVLREYLNHDEAAIRETCEIAVDKIVFDNSEQGKLQAKK